jgi:hypothetical protein
MLIGTDADDLNSTKNYTIGSILSVPGSSTYVPYTGGTNDVYLIGYGFYANEFVVPGYSSSDFLKADGSIDSTAYLPAATAASTYVPYTGATGNVNLGANSITANSLIKAGGLSSQFLKADGSVDSNTYATTAAVAAGYVPYSGATGNVTLGANKLTSAGLEITTDDATMVGIQCRPAGNNFFSIGDNGWTMSGFLVDFVNNRYFLGDWGSAVNGTYIHIDDVNQEIILSQALSSGGGVGVAGEVLISNGPGVAASWGPVPSEWTELEVDLVEAQIDTLGTPITLVAAPGIGSYYEFEITAEYDYGTIAYNLGFGTEIIIGYGDTEYSVGTFITGGSNRVVCSTTYNREVFLASPIVISTNDATNPANGDGTIKLKIKYKIKTFG